MKIWKQQICSPSKMCIHLVTVSRAATFSRMIAARKDAMLPRMKSGLDYRSESSMTIAGCIVHYRHANPNPDSHITMRVRIGVRMSVRPEICFSSRKTSRTRRCMYLIVLSVSRLTRWETEHKSSDLYCGRPKSKFLNSVPRVCFSSRESSLFGTWDSSFELLAL